MQRLTLYISANKAGLDNLLERNKIRSFNLTESEIKDYFEMVTKKSAKPLEKNRVIRVEKNKIVPPDDATAKEKASLDFWTNARIEYKGEEPFLDSVLLVFKTLKKHNIFKKKKKKRTYKKKTTKKKETKTETPAELSSERDQEAVAGEITEPPKETDGSTESPLP